MKRLIQSIRLVVRSLRRTPGSLAIAGMVTGLLGALLANRLLLTLLYQVSPTDGVTLGAVAVLLPTVAMLASIIPARLSTRIDPVLALRAEG